MKEKDVSDIGSGFLKEQIEEEIIKAHLILKSDDWKNVIEEIEKNDLLKGQIYCLLYFSKIYQFYTKNRSCDWDNQEDKKYLDTFKNYSKKMEDAIPFFANENENYLWERSVLSKGDYFITAPNNRKNLLNTTKNQRDYSWKRFLRERSGKLDFVKDVFDDKNFDSLDFEKIIENPVIKDEHYKLFLRNPELFRFCEDGFFGSNDIYNSDKVDLFSSINENIGTNRKTRLMRKSKKNCKQADLIIYDFWSRKLKNKKINQQHEIFHEEVSNTSDDTWIYCDFKIKENDFRFDIYYNYEDEKYTIYLSQKEEIMQLDDIKNIFGTIKEDFEIHEQESIEKIVESGFSEEDIINFINKISSLNSFYKVQ